MAEEKPRLAMLTQLQTKKIVSAKEIADKHQVSTLNHTIGAWNSTLKNAEKNTRIPLTHP